MGKAKITPLQVWIIGIVLTVIAGVSIYFALIKPTQQAVTDANGRYDAAKAVADKMPEAQKDRKKAEQEVVVAKAKWARYDREYMPNIDISNLLIGMQQLWHEQISVLQPKVEHFLEADKNVQIVSSSLTVAAPPSDPNAIARKAFVYDLGSVTVAGTFSDVLNNAARWNKFDRLVLMDGLTLAGNSPRLAGTYTLRCFEFTHGEKPGDAIPQSSGSAGNVGGGPGGPPDDAGGGPPPPGP